MTRIESPFIRCFPLDIPVTTLVYHNTANIAARAYVEEEGTEGDMGHYLNVKRALEESGGDVHIPRKMAERLMKRFGGDIYGGVNC